MSAALNSRPRNKNRQHNTSTRGSYQNANNYNRRETPEPETPSGVYADQRTAGMLCSILGTQATVKTVNGKTYKGRTTGFSDKGDIAMADAKLDDDDGTQGPCVAGIIIPKDKFVVCRTNGVDLKGLSASSADFTDSGIVSRMNGASENQLKVLQPWDDEDASEISTNLSLDDHTGGWDSESMFEENYQKFNVSSTYDEKMHEYTTRLPEPGTDSYAAREKFAKEKADEIERDETYQRRIAKELTDNDEDARFSFVHRDDSHSPHRPHESNSNKPNMYNSSRQSYPPVRGDRDREEHLRNGNLHRGQGRGGLQRQNSPFSSGGHMQHAHHVNNARQSVNNHYQGPPPSGPMNRNQGHGPSHLRQQQQQQPHQGPLSSSQNHSGPLPHQHHYSNQPHMSQQVPSQHRVSQHQQQVVSPTQPPPGKPPHHLPSQSVPSSPSSSSVQSHQPPSLQKASNQQQSHNIKAAPSPGQSVNGMSANQMRQQGPVQLNGDLAQTKPDHKGSNGPASEVAPSAAASVSSGGQQYSQPQHQHSPVSTASSTMVSSPSNAASSSQQKFLSTDGSVAVPSPSAGPPVSKAAHSPPSSVSSTVHTGRGGRNSETNPEEARSKIAEFQDFKEKFRLGEPTRQDETGEPPSAQAAPTPSVTQPAVSQPSSSPDTANSSVAQPASPEQSPAVETSSAEKKDEEPAPTVKTSTLNPFAKEFKPKAPVETQSPSPQPRSSPQVQLYPTHSPMMIVQQNPLVTQPRKRIMSANVDHLLGQPLLATQPPYVYVQGAPGAPLSAGYQVMGRVPNSITMAQGQHAGLDQAGVQSQPQPMFAFQWPLDLNPSAHVEGAAVPAQQQPMPAHLPHPQPAHAGPMQQQPPVQQAQPTHIPNPAPSPVHQQQQHPQHNGQPGLQQQPQHHQLGQGPPQSVTPQPTHYINYSQHGMPRTSLSGGAGQQSMPGHPTAVSISYMSTGPQYTSYQNASNGAQYSFAHAPATAAAQAQPQTSQNSSHGQGGSHPQYVVMPPAPQGHPPMPQHAGQAYQFTHAQHMQGPPQMPPNHGHNPNQGGHHLISHGMPGLQSFMPMPSTAQLPFPHQQ